MSSGGWNERSGLQMVKIRPAGYKFGRHVLLVFKATRKPDIILRWTCDTWANLSLCVLSFIRGANFKKLV